MHFFAVERMSIGLHTWSLYIFWLCFKTVCLPMEWCYASRRWYNCI